MVNTPHVRSVLRWSLLIGGAAVLAWMVLDTPVDRTTDTTPARLSLQPEEIARITSAQKLDRARPEEQKQAMENLLAGQPFVLVADGRAQRFTLSLSELVVDGGASGKRFEKLASPAPDARQLLNQARAAGGANTKLVLYPQGRENDAKARHFLGPRLLIQTQDRGATLAALKQHGLRLVDEPDYAPGSMIVEVTSGGPEAVFRALAALADTPGTTSVGPLLGRHHQKHLVPNDTYFALQWWLKNIGQSGGKAGTDMHVENVWNTYKGNGIRIAILDDGLDMLHPDLLPNVDSANHFDWNDSPYDTNPQPLPHADPDEEDSHGTSVSGVAAARGNNSLGVSGVAPEATLVGFRMLSTQDPDGTDDAEDADMMTRGKDILDVKNASWGTGAPAYTMTPAGPLMEAARQNATSTGRGGKGTVFVWSAGNGREAGEQGQKDGSTNSMHVTTVAAIANTGALATYSEGGSHLVVSAPSSGGNLRVYTTDLRGINGYNRTGTGSEPANRDYTSSFGGTSSAAPAVSGAVALMLDANPNLNWRDVKEILLRSSVQIPSSTAPNLGGWITRDGGDPSMPLIKHHEQFGGGLIDSQAAVAMAETWESLGAMTSSARSNNTLRAIPDNDTTGISIAYDFSALGLMRVEHATLRLDAVHNYRGDLEVTLRSPSGIISTLTTRTLEDDGNDFDNWVFSSVRHWGEAGAGIWTLTIKDLDATISGTYLSSTLTLHGTDVSPAPQITTHSPGPFLLHAGDPLSLTADGTGGGRLAFIWSRNGSNISGNTKTLDLPFVSSGQGGNYRVTAYNGAASAASADIAVGVVSVLPATVVVSQGSAFTLNSSATGPGLTHQWKHNGTALVNGPSTSGVGIITGATGPTLSITNMQGLDGGTYSCVVGMPGLVDTIEKAGTAVSITLKPTVVTPTFGNAVRSNAISIQLAASNNPTSYTVTGLPPGVTLNKTTGLISGRVTKPGSYTLTISATNSAGLGTAIQHPWVVEEFPAAAAGTWQGITDRNLDSNQNLGGKMKITVTSTGSCSGSLTLGTVTKSWTGYVQALPASTNPNANPTTSFTISMGAGKAPLTGTHTLDLTNKTFTGGFNTGLPATQTAFNGVRAHWSATNKPVSAVTVYNNALELPAGLVGDAAHPQGTGYAILSLSTAGVVTWTGKLADGSTVTGSSPLGSAGQTCHHGLLYTSTGSAQGWANINLATHLVDGSADWFKAAQKPTSTTRSHKAGIPRHDLALRGARYLKPAAGAMILGLTKPVSTTSTTPNARLLFTGAALAPLPAPLEQLFQVTAVNGVKMPAKAADNPKAVRLTLAATTGLLSGGFTLKDNDPLDLAAPFAVVSRTATCNGLIVTHPGINQGIGFFNLAELADETGEKNTTTKILSGKLELTAPPP